MGDGLAASEKGPLNEPPPSFLSSNLRGFRQFIVKGLVVVCVSMPIHPTQLQFLLHTLPVAGTGINNLDTQSSGIHGFPKGGRVGEGVEKSDDLGILTSDNS